MCYCDDCQSYLHHLGRAELLDANGGSEIIPVYPSEIKILSGHEQLVCTRLYSHGMFRFSTSCCKTPIGNTDPKRPWLGLARRIFNAKDPSQLDRIFPRIRAGIMGRFAKGQPPKGTPQKFNLNGMVAVMPFILKGIVTGKAKPSPFFKSDATPIVVAHILSDQELQAVRRAVGF